MTPKLEEQRQPPQDDRRALLARLMAKQAAGPETKARTAPMSYAQQRLWLLQRITPVASLYNIANTLRIGMAVDHEALRRSLEEIVRRHEILRTTFAAADGSLTQTIEPARAVELPVIDLAGFPLEARAVEAERVAAEEYAAPFDLRVLPLFRAKLLRLADDDYVFALTMHHILCDGWSLNVFFNELWTLYGAFREGRNSPLAPLPIQYADFAAWQRDFLNGDVRERQLSYWKRQLADLPALDLPADRPRPALPTFRGGGIAVTLHSGSIARLRALANERNATLFMALLAAFQTLIYRYTGQPDVVVGSPVAGRNNGDTEALIGFFVNSLVMRSKLAADASFRDAVDRVRETALGAYSHQDLPFEMLVDELQPERSVGRNPLFQAMFQVLQVADVHAAGRGGPLAPPVPTESAKFDVSLTLCDSGTNVAGGLEYARDLFDEPRMARMATHYSALVDSIAADPGQRLSHLNMLTEEERRLMLGDWLATSAPFPHDCGALEAFERRAAANPGARAAACGGIEITYGELDRRANGVALKLRELGAARGGIVAIQMPRSVEAIVAAVGILKTGAAYLPLDPATPGERRGLMLERSRALALVTQEFVGNAGAADAFPAPVYDPEALAYVIYTSGSTGEPKGVEIPHRGLTNLIAWNNRTFDVSAASRSSQFAAFGFDAAAWEIWPYLAAGASVEIVPDEIRYAPARLPQWLAAHAVTHCFVPSPILDTVARARWPESSKLQFLFAGGDRLTRGVPPGLPFPVFNMYGPTESSVVATAGIVPEDRGDSTSDHQGNAPAPNIGRAIANVETFIVDGNGQIVPIGIPGELWIGGSGLARGYLGAPEQTAERFVAHPLRSGEKVYRSGDLARYTESGEIEFLGRIDRQAKIRGFRIELGEVEAVLRQVSGAAGVCAMVREEGGEPWLAAYLTGIGGMDAAQLRARAADRLPDYMVPSAFVALDEFPLTSNGKIDRNALPAPPRATVAAAAYAAPQSEMEERLCAIWAAELRRDRVGIDENFFEAGGNSLSLVRVHLKLEEALERTIPVVDLFRYSTVRSLAAYLSAASAGKSAVEKARERGARRREMRG
jgi:amino acid adenylation domain-containing protein